MLESTSEYARAITGQTRRILPRVPMDLIDPDIVYGTMDSSGQTAYSYPAHLVDKNFERPPLMATLEKDRWRLDGTYRLYPDDPAALAGEHGIMLTEQSREDGSFARFPFFQLNVSGLDILQAAAIYFTGHSFDGVAESLTLEVFSGDTVGYSNTVSGNRENAVFWEGFTVRSVTSIRVTFLRWSLPWRFPRVLELVPGIFEIWGGDELFEVDVLQETSLDNLTCPYGVATLVCHNKNQRFNPHNMSGLFQSIEDRQPIPIQYGVETANGMEYLPLGTFYQQKDGWENNAYHLKMSFRLVDIVGLVAGRKFILPSPAPVTVEGWISAIVGHLGDKFKNRYLVNGAVAAMPMQGVPVDLSCGDVLRYVCMASGTFFRADAETGFLRVEPVGALAGVYIDEDNLYDYPTNEPTASVATLIFRLPDGTDCTVQGTAEYGEKNLTVSNPFITTPAQAQAAATHILRWYGGFQYTLSGRGDMRCELGDYDTFDTGFGGTTQGRRWKQQLKISGGMMKRVPSYLLGEVVRNG